LQLAQVEAAAELINKQRRPYILAGQGVLLAGASERVNCIYRKTVEFLLPARLLGLGALPCDHPNYVGFLGMHGNYAPNINTNQCDVLNCYWNAIR
jgi:acetolactate synthase-1/2/3 large subunit